jgi:hypothetical protein
MGDVVGLLAAPEGPQRDSCLMDLRSYQHPVIAAGPTSAWMQRGVSCDRLGLMG